VSLFSNRCEIVGDLVVDVVTGVLRRGKTWRLLKVDDQTMGCARVIKVFDHSQYDDTKIRKEITWLSTERTNDFRYAVCLFVVDLIETCC